MDNTEIFYHGSGVLFDAFDLEHALEGDGKVKFGYGVYVTSAYSSAAHYSGANDSWDKHFVYTVKVPAKTDENYIAFKQPVNPAIIKKAEEKLGIEIPVCTISDGKDFRKFLVKLLSKNICIDPLPGTDVKSLKNLMGEKAASDFLSSIGVDFIEWPYNWKNLGLGTNRAVLNDKKIEIIRIDQVHLDNKKKLIADSIIQIR